MIIDTLCQLARSLVTTAGRFPDGGFYFSIDYQLPLIVCVCSRFACKRAGLMHGWMELPDEIHHPIDYFVSAIGCTMSTCIRYASSLFRVIIASSRSGMSCNMCVCNCFSLPPSTSNMYIYNYYSLVIRGNLVNVKINC